MSTELAESKEEVNAVAESHRKDEEQRLILQRDLLGVGTSADVGELHKTTEVTVQNQELEINETSLSVEKIKTKASLGAEIVEPTARTRELKANGSPPSEERDQLGNKSTLDITANISSSSEKEDEDQPQQTIDNMDACNPELQSDVISSIAKEKAKVEAPRLAEEEKDRSITTEQNNGSIRGEEHGELRKTIRELTKRNLELEENVASLWDRAKLEALEEHQGLSEIAPATAASSCTADNDGDGGDPHRTISELTRQIQELEATVASLSDEKAKLTARLAKDKSKALIQKSEARGRRKRFERKLANMSEKLKEDFGDEFDVETSFDVSEKDGDTSD